MRNEPQAERWLYAVPMLALMHLALLALLHSRPGLPAVVLWHFGPLLLTTAAIVLMAVGLMRSRKTRLTWTRSIRLPSSGRHDGGPAWGRVGGGDRDRRVGNSGKSTEPHVHVHLQTTMRGDLAEGIPLYFHDYLLDGQVVDRGIPTGGRHPQVVQHAGPGVAPAARSFSWAWRGHLRYE